MLLTEEKKESNDKGKVKKKQTCPIFGFPTNRSNFTFGYREFIHAKYLVERMRTPEESLA